VTSNISNHPEKTFGNTEDTGCKAEPWTFTADYICPMGRMGAVDWNATAGTVTLSSGETVNIADLGIDWSNAKSLLDGADPPGFVCVGQPRVFVMDNWGWCAGSCLKPASGEEESGHAGQDIGPPPENEKLAGSGCYNEPPYLQCDPNTVRPWVKYNGYVIVVPQY
jgi:hypothetical protein